MPSIKDIINEEIMTTVANYPQFGDRLRSISEVGEGSSTAFPFEFDNISDNEVHYYFSTEKFDYDVILNGEPRSRTWDMQFGAVGGTPADVTNEGKAFKIMSTLVQITNNFIEKFKPNVLRFKPEKDEEYDGDDKRRYNLYMAFIKKHMIRDYTVYERADYIIIQRLNPIKSNIPKI